MRFAAWNIQRGLISKMEAIQHLADIEKLDMFALTEVDFEHDYKLPLEDEFDCFRSPENPSRLVVYCRKSLKMKELIYQGDLPAVVLESSQCSFGFVYSEFTAHAYTNLRINVTDKQRCSKLLDFFNWFVCKAKRNCFIFRRL